MMRTQRFYLLALAVGGAAITGFGAAHAEEGEAKISMTLAPVKYVFVDGNTGKFQAHHWMAEGYSGGIKDYSGEFTLPNGIEIESKGHALIDAGDIGSEFSVKKDDLGYFNFEYEQFRKYFDTGAGVSKRFAQFPSPDTDKDLTLNIGKFGFETGLTIEGLPNVSFGYEREFKNGAKSRLTWPSVKEAGETRKIGPSWQEVEEKVDTFDLKASHELAGVNLKAEQKWENARSENTRFENQLANTNVASDLKIRRQNQLPTSNLMQTTLGGDRSFLEDKVFVSSGYHFNHLRATEFETLAEFSGTGVLTNYTYPEQEPNNHANSEYDSHTWVQSLTVRPLDMLSLGTNFKSEVIKRKSDSVRNHDGLKTAGNGTANAPDGTVDSVDSNTSDTSAVRWGEQFSVRFTGIPRTALYTELELEQTRMLLREDEQSSTPTWGAVTSFNNNAFSRETVTHVNRGVWTLGGRIAPIDLVDVTSQVRRRVYNNDYDDQRETVNSSSSKSAFFDGQSIHTDEFSTRVTLKPCRWFRPSFRYQLRSDKYATRAQAQPIVKTSVLSNIYTFDVVAQPLPELSTTASFSRQTASNRTPASSISTNPGSGLPVYTIPTFNSDVNTWLFGADYSVRPNVTLSSTLQYSLASNFNDQPAVLTYGADFRKLDLTTGVTWALRDNTSVGAEYDLYTYDANDNVEVGDYTAHVLWLDVTRKF